MTPQLQMAIKLLQLSRLELMDTIRQELEENPALEEVIDSAGDEPLGEGTETLAAPPTEMPANQEVTIQEKIHDEIDWAGFLEDFSTPPSRVTVESEDREAPKYEAFITRKESLNDHLLWQFLMTKPKREDEGSQASLSETSTGTVTSRSPSKKSAAEQPPWSRWKRFWPCCRPSTPSACAPAT